MLTVNTVAPSSADEPAVDDCAVAGRIGPLTEACDKIAATAAEQLSVEQAEPIAEPMQERSVHSAKVDLFITMDDGTTVPLGAVGPEHVVVDQSFVGNLAIGSHGVLVICIDDRRSFHDLHVMSAIDPVSGKMSVKTVPVEGEPQAPVVVVQPTESAANFIANASEVVQRPSVVVAVESEDAFWAEVKLLAKLRECEQARDTLETKLTEGQELKSRLERELMEIEAALPAMKENVNTARNQSLAVAKQLWQLKTTGQIPAVEPAAQPAVATEQAEQATTAEPEAVDESWRLVTTRELLTSEPPIAGLGKKKLENITDAAPTVGDLVDLISEGSKAHKQFHEMLPKGCGRGLADEIEKRIGDLVIARAKEASLGTASALADELLNAQRKTAASEAWRPEDCQPSKDDSEHTKLGFAAFNDGKPHTALPTQNRELARQWMLGWVCAEVIKHKADAPQPVESDEPSESAEKSQDAEPNPAAVAGKKPRAKKAK